MEGRMDAGQRKVEVCTASSGEGAQGACFSGLPFPFFLRTLFIFILRPVITHIVGAFLVSGALTSAKCRADNIKYHKNNKYYEEEEKQ